MAVNLGDSQIWHRLFGDAEVGQLFSDSAELRAMLLVEGALAEAQGRLGLIPEISAAAIQRASREVLIDPAGLAEDAARDGVVVPALVAAFRAAMQAPEHARYIHWGATSQDIQDTGLVLRLRRALDLIETRLRATIAALADRAEAHQETVIVARTRWQLATPTTLGARIAGWGMPMLRHLERLQGLRPRLLVLSLAGASGNLSAMGGQGPQVARDVAATLGLGVSDLPWHSARDNVAELAMWCAGLAASLDKMGGDLLGSALAGEGLRAGAGGGSSTMPHKVNPTGAEALVSLSAQLGGLAEQVRAASAQRFERDGAAWGQEMLSLPGMIVATAAALRHAEALATSLQADADRLRAPIDETGGLVLAEAASFAWAEVIGLPEARARVKAACSRVAEGAGDLRGLLEAEAPDMDWATVFSGQAATGQAQAIARSFVTAARDLPARD